VRYFLVSRSGNENAPRIIAEIVREYFDRGQHRDATLASALTGDGTTVALLQEIVTQPGGGQALMRWRRKDDRDFDRETAMLAREIVKADSGTRHLRVVGSSERRAVLQPSEDILSRSALLIARSRELVRQAQEVRAELRAGAPKRLEDQ
jgi:hypothetical protein